MRERLADRPPRPLADAPTAQLSDAADELARDWLIELLARLPLADAATLALEPLASDGPGLCRALVAALASDQALAALRPGGDHEALIVRACTAAAARQQPEVPGAVESLRRVLWSAARAELGARPSAELVEALSDRLAHVCATVVATAVASGTPDTAAAPSEEGGRSAEGAPGPSAPARAAESLDFVVRDARDARAADTRRSDWEAELRDALSAAPVRSLLLVDIDGHERVLAADGRTALQRAERALVRSLVDDATMVCERLGRYWVVTGGDADATEFAQRLGAAVAGEPGQHGAPLTASIGVTLLDDAEAQVAHERADGEELAERLCGRAEEAMLSARAAGAGVDSR